MARSDQILAAFADAVLPHEANAPEVGAQAVVVFVADFRRRMPRLYKILFPLGLWLLEYCRLRPFSTRSRSCRVAFLRAFSHSRIRLFRDLFKALRAVCLMAYYADPRVQSAVGYAHEPFLAEVKATRLARYAHDL